MLIILFIIETLCSTLFSAPVILANSLTFISCGESSNSKLVFCDVYFVLLQFRSLNSKINTTAVLQHSLLQVRNEFAVTEKMSTYLVAFVICDFGQNSEQTGTNNITVSVIAAKDKLAQADFALHTAVNITEHYEEYFGIRYPLPKQGEEIE